MCTHTLKNTKQNPHSIPVSATLHPCVSATLHPCVSATLHPCVSATLHPCVSATLHPCVSATLHPCVSATLPSLCVCHTPSLCVCHTPIPVCLPHSIPVCLPQSQRSPGAERETQVTSAGTDDLPAQPDLGRGPLLRLLRDHHLSRPLPPARGGEETAGGQGQGRGAGGQAEE